MAKIQSKRSFLDRNIHHYKNHNIFEPQPERKVSKSTLVKKQKLGAMYHPHEIDPYSVASDPIVEGPAAGVSTNYGLARKIVQDRSEKRALRGFRGSHPLVDTDQPYQQSPAHLYHN